jgi:glycosyltransferase involved in cell wall biosynthesis
MWERSFGRDAGMTASAERRILLVSYHFGRDWATGGIRWNAMARDLAADGWLIDVITLERDGFQPPFTAEEQPGLEVFPVPGSEAPVKALKALSRFYRFLRGGPRQDQAAPAAPNAPVDMVAVDRTSLDRQIQSEIWRSDERRPLRQQLTSALDGLVAWASDTIWSRRAVRKAGELVRARRYRAVVVSSPPHYTQSVGARIAAQYGVPYVADYRDPWLLGIEWLRNYFNAVDRVLARVFEPRWLRCATVIIHNTPRACSVIGSRFSPAITGRHISVPNGYDPLPGLDAPDQDHFRVVFTGWLYPYMDPRPVFAACRALIEQRKLGTGRLAIEFVGTAAQFAGADLRRVADAYGVGALFSRRERVPRDEARRIQQRAAVMVAYDCPHPLSVPSKFYEYAQLSGTMLLLGNPDGAMADAAATLGVAVHALGDQQGIDAALLAAYDRWERGELDKPLDRDGNFDRRRQAAVMRDVLSTL